MIGRKQLNTIRKELRDALAKAHSDPLQWLEERMAAPNQQEGEVLQSLKRVLETPKRKPRRKKTVRAKK